MRRLFIGLAVFAVAACKGNEAPPPAQPPATTAPPPASPSSGAAPQPSASASAPPAQPAGPPKDMNVIVLSIDSMRADMPWAGYSRDIAPRLTALEKTAVSYTKAYAVSSYTS